VTSQSDTDTGKESLIMEQLKELGLEEYTDVFKKSAEDDDDPSRIIILISITVPDDILNE